MASRRALVIGVAGAAASRRGRGVRALGRRSRPPRMILRAGGGGAQRGVRGAFCWNAGCIDTGHVAPECPLVVAVGETLALFTGMLGALRLLSYEVRRYAEQTRILLDPSRDDALSFPVSWVPMPSDLPPGLYVIDVVAETVRGSSTYQGFKLYVNAVSSTAIPMATPSAEPVGGNAER